MNRREGVQIGQSWFILELYTPENKEFPMDFVDNSTSIVIENKNEFINKVDEMHIEYVEHCTSINKDDTNKFIQECESSIFNNKSEVIHIEHTEHSDYRRDK